MLQRFPGCVCAAVTSADAAQTEKVSFVRSLGGKSTYGGWGAALRALAHVQISTNAQQTLLKTAVKERIELNGNIRSTRRLLICGVAAGIIYIVVGLAQILLREGFDVTRHPLSMMSLGQYGWVQIANFLVSGALVVLGAIGLYRAERTSRSWRIGAILLGVYGLCVMLGGLFSTDPSLGFPPGTPDAYPETMSWHALLHFIVGQLGFLALIIATFFFARYFAVKKVTGWVWFSVLTGVIFLASIVAIVAAMGQAWASIALYLAVALAWVWLSLLSARTLRNLPTKGSLTTN